VALPAASCGSLAGSELGSLQCYTTLLSQSSAALRFSHSGILGIRSYAPLSLQINTRYSIGVSRPYKTYLRIAFLAPFTPCSSSATPLINPNILQHLHRKVIVIFEVDFRLRSYEYYDRVSSDCRLQINTITSNDL